MGQKLVLGIPIFHLHPSFPHTSEWTLHWQSRVTRAEGGERAAAQVNLEVDNDVMIYQQNILQGSKLLITEIFYTVK